MNNTRIPRPEILTGVTSKVDSPNGKIFITINHDEEENIVEVILNCGKNGSDIMALANALGRMITFNLRLYSVMPSQARIEKIISELSGLGGTRSIEFGEDIVKSLPDAVEKTLAKHYGLQKK